uniref:DUF5009 domain-containing protein n=1 Tax=candidate division WOR-3 bacterium TaxID=2052148 RepID=A0A7C6A8X6_UNCW3
MGNSQKLSFVYFTSVQNRWKALDILRGVAIFFMILGNFLANYNVLPSWLWHATWNGLTIADLGVPIFLLALGVSYQFSFSKRITQFGKFATIFHFLKRYLTLFIFGFGGYRLAMGRFEWEVLQLIGAVGIFGLGFMFLKPLSRIIIAFVLLIFYELTILDGALNWVLKFTESGLGGPYAILAWSFTLLFGSTLAHWIMNKKQNETINLLAFSGLILIILGIFLSLVVPFNKHLVSISYVLFTTGVAVGGLLFFHFVTEIWLKRIPIFDSIGKNALICYITSQLLTVIVTKILPSKISTSILLTNSVIILLVCIALALFLDSKKIYIRV